MSTYKRIDYLRLENQIRQRLHQHFSTENALISYPACGPSEQMIAHRKWMVDIHIPNLPMTMTFYGPTRIVALKNAAHLLEFYVKGPSTADAQS